jgi:hypothetical protein
MASVVDSSDGGRRVPDGWLEKIACATRTYSWSFWAGISSGDALIVRRSTSTGSKPPWPWYSAARFTVRHPYLSSPCNPIHIAPIGVEIELENLGGAEHRPWCHHADLASPL